MACPTNRVRGDKKNTSTLIVIMDDVALSRSRRLLAELSELTEEPPDCLITMEMEFKILGEPKEDDESDGISSGTAVEMFRLKGKTETISRRLWTDGSSHL
ncbi:unnamed protein product [Caenorhabditis auriculariae]|uniref:Uncharacterized protein n=1 Tax=Caenorhabditis auriculariae TaxID=2777116 RepID=A0A8S1HUL6_9PELO|nr:unnamed protein product [Caenorhabditis auriculariae]